MREAWDWVSLVPTTTDQNQNLYGLYNWELLSSKCTVIPRQITRVLDQLHFQSLPFHTLWSCTSVWHLGGRRKFLLRDSWCPHSKYKPSRPSKQEYGLALRQHYNWEILEYLKNEWHKECACRTVTLRGFCRAIFQVLNSINLHVVPQIVCLIYTTLNLLERQVKIS